MNTPTNHRVLRITALCLSLVGLASLTACRDEVMAPYGADADPVTHPMYPKVTVDAWLKQTTAVDYTAIVVDAATETRPIAVSVPLRSRSDNDMWVRYQVRWLDGRGRQVGATEWKEAQLFSRRNVFLKANALSAEAVDWRIDIQTPIK